MIDWHSHVLCGIDDGAKTPEESILMLSALYESGVDTVCATPHFHADRITVDGFLQSREDALGKIKETAKGQIPRILLGAEVRYYPGISRMERLAELCIENTGLLLLEMPFSKWTEYTQRELRELAGSAPFGVVLAHIERYLKLQDRKTWQRIYEAGLYTQVNASFFIGFSQRRKVLKLIKNGYVQFLGSDCHSVVGRIPLMGEACRTIEKKLGEKTLKDLSEQPRRLLKLSPVNH